MTKTAKDDMPRCGLIQNKKELWELLAIQ